MGFGESNNLAIQGIAKANPSKKKIIISSIEHSSIYECCNEMKKEGYQIVEIPVDSSGLIDFSILENSMDRNTLLVSIMHSNNEIGTIQNIGKIGELCRKNKVLFHTDEVQSFGKEKIDVNSMKIDLMSASGHKIGASKGIGFLYVREGTNIRPIVRGGSQELGIRPGTQNVPGIAGLSKAVSIAQKVNKNEIRELRDYFIEKLENLGGKINGSKEKRLANNVNVSFPGKDGDRLMLRLSEKGIMCSTRSACTSKQTKENRILTALGLNDKEIKGTLRFSLSERNDKKEVDLVIKELKKII
ncbi:MAG: cysteine desulfurase family protein [archaeon]